VDATHSRPLAGGTLALAFAVALSAAPAAAQAPASCPVVSQNLAVRDVMTQVYLWDRFLPQVDPARFDSPEAYLEALRYRPLDGTFSYISSRAADEAFFSASQFTGVGLSTRLSGNALRITQVFPLGPADQAGLRRGDRIVEIADRTVDALVATGEIGAAFGPAQAGVQVTLLVERRDGTRLRTTLTKRSVTIPTVGLAQVIEVDGRRVGYLHFRTFVQPSFRALDEAFALFKTSRVHDLVLDLRYNGGGLVQVAQHLAGLLGGALTAGQVFAEFSHNDRHRFLDRRLRFETPSNALGIARLFAITTRASASASELVLNALRPFIPVVIIGDRTFGKPVGQYSFTFCDKVIHPVAFALRNAKGEGDFFDGLPAACPAADDLDFDLGDPREASLAEAVAYIRTGRCRTPAAGPAAALGARADRAAATPESRPEARDGWQVLTNAY
jgi:C-terminal peptidase prc